MKSETWLQETMREGEAEMLALQKDFEKSPEEKLKEVLQMLAEIAEMEKPQRKEGDLRV